VARVSRKDSATWGGTNKKGNQYEIRRKPGGGKKKGEDMQVSSSHKNCPARKNLLAGGKYHKKMSWEKKFLRLGEGKKLGADKRGRGRGFRARVQRMGRNRCLCQSTMRGSASSVLGQQSVIKTKAKGEQGQVGAHIQQPRKAYNVRPKDGRVNQKENKN